MPGQKTGFCVALFWDLKLNLGSLPGTFSQNAWLQFQRAPPWLLCAPSCCRGGGVLPGVLTRPASCRYVGELISDSEADVREEDSYLFDLDNKVMRLEGLGLRGQIAKCVAWGGRWLLTPTCFVLGRPRGWCRVACFA